MKQNAKELIAKIQQKLPRLMELREGQVIIFRECVHLVGYDISVDFAKTCNENFKILGIKPNLADVLEWHSLDNRNKYSHFEVSKGEGYFSIYDGEERESLIWNLQEPIENQSDELINCLLELC